MSNVHSAVFKSCRRWGALVALFALAMAATLLFNPSALFSAEAQSAQTPAVAQPKEATSGNYHLKATGIPDDAWPNPTLEFSIESIDGARFEALRESDIKVTLNGRDVPIRRGSLKPRSSAAKRVYLMIDRSGSMVDERGGMNKLEAARKSLKTFIERLGPRDSASLVTFADGPDTGTAVSDTPDQEKLKRAANSITHSTSQFTQLYNSAEFALRKSGESGIQDVIFLSDGLDQPDREMTDIPAEGTAAFEAYKRSREQKIARLAHDKKIRIFTIAVGVLNGSGYSRVDYDSLKRMADNGFPGGKSKHIDLNKLKSDVASGLGTFEELLEQQLDDTLREFKKEMSYSYSLELDMPGDVEHRDGVLNIAAIVPDGQQRSKLPVEYPYFWPQGASSPSFGKPHFLPPEPVPVLIEVVSPKVPPPDRVGIYLKMLLAFAALSLIPPATGLLTTGRRELRARKSITSVGVNSRWLSKLCPNERDAYGGQFTFKEGDNVIVCPECDTPHHLSCWKFGGYKCMKDGCGYEMPLSAEVLAKYGLK